MSRKIMKNRYAQLLETLEPAISAPTATVRFLQKESAASSRYLKLIRLSASGASLERVEEVRIETVYPAGIEKSVIKAMSEAHPYEEVAFDIYPVEQNPLQKGLGRIGELNEEMTLEAFARYVKEKLEANGARMVGKSDAKVKKVAVLGGDGNKYIHHAKRMGADVYVTGDLYFHTAHDAMMIGLNVVDPGHYAEQIMKNGVAKKLTAMCREKNLMSRSFHRIRIRIRLRLYKKQNLKLLALQVFAFTLGKILCSGTS